MTNQPMCTVSTDAFGAAPVVEVVGEVDVATSPDLRAALLDPALDPTTLLIVDMRAVTFLDSTGLSALVAGHNRFTDAGGDLRVVIDTPQVRRVLQVTGLDGALSVFPTLTGAQSAA